MQNSLAYFPSRPFCFDCCFFLSVLISILLSFFLVSCLLFFVLRFVFPVSCISFACLVSLEIKKRFPCFVTRMSCFVFKSVTSCFSKEWKDYIIMFKPIRNYYQAAVLYSHLFGNKLQISGQCFFCSIEMIVSHLVQQS